MTKDVSACNSIIFDFSGVIGPKIKTLESWRGMERRMLGLVWDELNPTPEVRREKVHEMKSRHKTAALHAAIKKELDERGSKLDLHSILKVFYHAERQALERDFSKWNMHADAIRALRKSGFSMAVMSNSMQCYVEHFLAASGISGNFKHVITPESIGWESKPGKAAYEHALRITGFSPTSTIFIDNKPENLAIPIEMGMVGLCIGEKHNLGSIGFKSRKEAFRFLLRVAHEKRKRAAT